MWWVVDATSLPLYPQEREKVPTVQEAGWAPGPVWTGAQNLCTFSLLVSLCWLSWPVHLSLLTTQHKHTCPRWDSNPHALHSADTGFGSSITRPTSQQRVAMPTEQSRTAFSTTEQVKAVRTENCSYRPRQWDSSSSQLPYASRFLPDETNVAGDSKRQTWWLRYGTKPWNILVRRVHTETTCFSFNRQRSGAVTELTVNKCTVAQACPARDNATIFHRMRTAYKTLHHWQLAIAQVFQNSVLARRDCSTQKSYKIITKM